MRILTLVFLFFQFINATSQHIQRNAAEILQGINKLNTVGSVLYIAAHPDDENTRLLTYLSKERNLRTAYLSLTRGDGGQNLVGKEQGELLGLLRTQELLEARKIDGAEQYFTNATDFGYSKTPQETFSIWNKDSVLKDVVWVIRKFRPDVIICRFPTTGEGGHGHHTASALVALDAFDAAADKNRFPEQLKHVSVWQAKRVLWNTFNFGTVNTTSPEQLKIDVGGFNPLTGKSYGETAAESRSMHKSQGFGSAKARGTQIEYFKFLKGDSAKSDIFENADLSWNRFAEAAYLKDTVLSITRSFDPFNPHASVRSLLEFRKQLLSITSKDPHFLFWKNQKVKETEALIIDCAGLYVEATTSTVSLLPKGKLELTINAINRTPLNIRLKTVTWPSGKDSIATKDLLQNNLLTLKHREELKATTWINAPYWLMEPQLSPGRYNVKSSYVQGLPEAPPAIKVKAEFEVEGEQLILQIPVLFKSTDPVKGEEYRKPEILPPVSIEISDKLLVFTGENSKTLKVKLRSLADSVSGVLKVNAPSGWQSSGDVPFSIKGKDSEWSTEVVISVSKDQKARDGKIEFSAVTSEGTYNYLLQRVMHEHIEPQFTVTPAEVKLRIMALQKKNTNIGYIPGAGDDVPAALRQAGYSVTILDDELLASADLSQFSAIVTGVRAYNTNEKLVAFYPKLMIFVENGGNLIVQYNTNNRIGPLSAKIFPYPFTITRDRVTNENSPVAFIDLSDPVLKFPNRITEEDFRGWVQERGIYFAGEMDKHYRQVLTLTDPGDKPMSGSLIIARHGKGNLVYTGLAFFRQLPAGVPGAFRLFANLIGLPANE